MKHDPVCVRHNPYERYCDCEIAKEARQEGELSGIYRTLDALGKRAESDPDMTLADYVRWVKEES